MYKIEIHSTDDRGYCIKHTDSEGRERCCDHLCIDEALGCVASILFIAKEEPMFLKPIEHYRIEEERNNQISHF